MLKEYPKRWRSIGMVSVATFVLGILTLSSFSQTVIPFYKAEDFKAEQIDSLKQLYGNKKKLPQGYELQALLALSHYPELRDIKVKFKIRKGGAPFVSRPTVWSTFFKSAPKRNYLIIIRSKPHPMFDPILLPAMRFNAQVGVLGHELAHTSDYSKRGFSKMMQVVFGNLSWKFLDEFEFETDRRAVHHGLGFQILAWSEHAVKTLRVNEPAEIKGNSKIDGIMQRERYMRPATVRKEMSELAIYDRFDIENAKLNEISDK
ncbi:MAG: hypothetical protein AAFN93_00860 [Bacteroidota bacterium]